MNLLSILTPLQAANEQVEGATGAGLFDNPMGLLLMGGLVVVMYFLMVRPQKKKEKETKAMLDAMKKGDKVQSIGGIKGIVKQLKDDTVIVEIDPNTKTKIEFVRNAIAMVLDPSADEKSGSEETTEENLEK